MDKECGKEQFTILKRMAGEGVQGDESFEPKSEGEEGSQEGI